MKMILDKRGNKYVHEEGKDFHSDLGIVEADKIDKSRIGDIVKSHTNHEFKIMKPNINDYIDIMERRCSILVQKDIGYVLAHTGLGEGCRVIDAGTGAAASALYFGNVVGIRGKVYSYEIRQDFAQVAKTNIEKFGMQNINIKHKDVREGFDERGIDLVFLDLPKPVKLFDNAHHALALGGWLVVYFPYINQLDDAQRVAKRIGFYNIETVEIFKRDMDVRKQGTRPNTRMVGHTGYLFFARKL